jgi:hypothetical protein
VQGRLVEGGLQAGLWQQASSVGEGGITKGCIISVLHACAHMHAAH